MVNNLWLSRLGGTFQWFNDATFCKNYLVSSLGDGELYSTAPHRSSTQTLDSSQAFERRILQKQPKIINEIIKSCDKNAIKYPERVSPKQAHDSIS